LRYQRLLFIFLRIWLEAKYFVSVAGNLRRSLRFQLSRDIGEHKSATL